ncbi:(2E,6E)-farnesyl diphosphate synthase [Spongorhabdus nitratireducens]
MPNSSLSSHALLEGYAEQCQQRVDNCLRQVVTGADGEPQHGSLQKAMAYSLFSGGKRVRPMLVYAACEALGGNLSQADPAACAVELIHAYSLVHDDLPAMDDDDLRRGKPTCHIAFDEAAAILAGDALQALAFEVLARRDLLPEADLPSDIRLQQITALADASGRHGMVGGQALDLAAVATPLTLSELENMHQCKTGALIRASIRLGALASGCSDQDKLQQLDDYARAIGLAFQIQDDIIDVSSDTETLGKQQGADESRQKPTYVSLLGLKGAREKARELHGRALNALSGFDASAAPLRSLADFIVSRNH